MGYFVIRHVKLWNLASNKLIGDTLSAWGDSEDDTFEGLPNGPDEGLTLS